MITAEAGQTSASIIIGRISSILTAFATGVIATVAIATALASWGLWLALFIGIGSFAAEGIMFWRDVPRAFARFFGMGVQADLRDDLVISAILETLNALPEDKKTISTDFVSMDKRTKKQFFANLLALHRQDNLSAAQQKLYDQHIVPALAQTRASKSRGYSHGGNHTCGKCG